MQSWWYIDSQLKWLKSAVNIIVVPELLNFVTALGVPYISDIVYWIYQVIDAAHYHIYVLGGKNVKLEKNTVDCIQDPTSGSLTIPLRLQFFPSIIKRKNKSDILNISHSVSDSLRNYTPSVFASLNDILCFLVCLIAGNSIAVVLGAVMMLHFLACYRNDLLAFYKGKYKNLVHLDNVSLMVMLQIIIVFGAASIFNLSSKYTSK